jgi:hypothetical protein
MTESTHGAELGTASMRSTGRGIDEVVCAMVFPSQRAFHCEPAIIHNLVDTTVPPHRGFLTFLESLKINTYN